MEIKTALVEEFNSELEEVGKMEVGTEQHKIAVDSVTKMADRIIEIKKLDIQEQMKEAELIQEAEIKAQQMKDEKKDKVVRNVISVAIPMVQLAAAGLVFVMSTNFERNGTFTTEGGKISVKELLRFKR